MKKIMPPFFYLFVNIIIFYLFPLFIQDTGSGMLILLIVFPVCVFLAALFFGKYQGFSWWYSFLVSAIFASTILLFYNSSANIYIVIYWFLAFIWNLLGYFLSKKETSLKKWDILLGIWVVVFVSAFAYLLFPDVEFYDDNKTTISSAWLFQKVQFDTPDGCKASWSWFGIHFEGNYEYYHNKLCKNKQETAKHDAVKDTPKYPKRYDAWEYLWDESLTLDNEEAQKIREKIDRKNNPFYTNWKHKKVPHDSKQSGDFRIETIDGKDWYMQYEIKKDGKKLYTSTKTMFLVDDPLRNFVTKWNDWWLLYSENQRPSNPAMSSVAFHTRLIHNWEELNYESAFWLHNVSGKIVYFFKKDKNSKIQYYFDWNIYDTDFDEIIHDRCCEYAAYNMWVSLDWRVYFWWVIWKKFSYNEMILPGFTMHLWGK